MGQHSGSGAATTGAAVAIGPLISGALTTWLSWRSIFFVNIPIGIAATSVAVAKLRETRDEEHGGVDWIGLVTLSGALFTFVFTLLRGNDKGWSSALIVTMLAAAVAVLAVFVVSQWRGRKPMVELELFRNPSFTGAHITAFAISCAVFSMFLYLTLYLQDVLHYKAIGAAPQQLRAPLQHLARHAFVSGLNELFVVAAGVAAIGAVFAFLLVRRRDFVRAAAPELAAS